MSRHDDPPMTKERAIEELRGLGWLGDRAEEARRADRIIIAFLEEIGESEVAGAFEATRDGSRDW